MDVIRIDWSRAEKTATHPGWDGFGGEFAAAGSDDAWMDVTRLLVAAGVSDGPAEVFDETGVRCWSVPSLYRCAWRYRPTVAQVAADTEYRSWFPRHRVARTAS